MAEQVKHTAGPWVVGQGLFIDCLGKYGVVVTAEARNICTLELSYYDAAANAALIAAAPDLLRELQKALSIITEEVPEMPCVICGHSECDPESCGMASIRAAIAKATRSAD